MGSFYERYVECCREKGILPSSQATAELIGCTRSNISQIANKGIIPKGEIVARAAKMLGVSADYLLGLTDTPQPINNSITKQEQTMLTLFRELNEEGRDAALAMLNGLTQSGIYKKCDPDSLDQEEA